MKETEIEKTLYAMALAEVFKFDEVLADNLPISMHGAVIDPVVRIDALEEL